MGQCCTRAPDERSLGSNDGTKKISRKGSKHQKSKDKLTPKHQPDSPDINNDEPSDDDEEEIDLSEFQEDVVEFIEFWHEHFDTLSKESIHNSLVNRIHNKLKEEYEKFPREAVSEFIETLPELLEVLETLLNIAIDGDVQDALSMYKEYQPLLMATNTDNINNNNPSTLPVPPSPSRSKSRSKSNSKSNRKESMDNNKPSDIILTDKHGIDLDDINTSPPSFRKLPQTPDDTNNDDDKEQQEQEEDDDDDDDDTVVEGDSLDAPQPIYDVSPESFFRFEMETAAADDAEIAMVGIMRTLWFERVQKFVTKCGLNEEMDDIFFILSNALETAIGTFREYVDMMESFSLYIRQALRTTLELIRAIINDLPLNTVQERIYNSYDDPFSILIHFADRCDIACEFWNDDIWTLSHDLKLQLSMRVYSYAVMGVEQETYQRLKQKGAIVTWSTLLLDFMQTIIRFFTRNRHQDLISYLLIYRLIPSTLLGNMGEWLDQVFATHFDEEVYNIECSDAVQFIFAFVGEVMSGGYDVADEINENIASQHEFAQSLSQCPAHSVATKPSTGTALSDTKTGVTIHSGFKSVIQGPMTYNDVDDEDIAKGTGYAYPSSTTLAPGHNLGVYIGNSPLSRLDSPTLTPRPIFQQPGLTPPGTYQQHDEMMNDGVTLHIDKGNLKRDSLRSSNNNAASTLNDNHVIKLLAPSSHGTTHNYTNNAKYSHYTTKKKKHNKMLLNRMGSMHFLQKIMDMEGKKIIVDLSIFHQYRECAQQFWSRYIDNDPSVRYKISDLLGGEKQINFVEMFSIYFKLVAQYMEKCKISANPNGLNESQLITPALRNQPNSSNKTNQINGNKPSHHHKRTFSHRNSMSLGLTKFKYRSETTRDSNILNGCLNGQKLIGHHHINNHFHAEGQFFVREMLRIGRKHRNHNIEEKTLKLVAKCLIEVIEKQFRNKFNDKIKRAFTIALKLGIKFMCVEPGKTGKNDNNNHKYYKSRSSAKPPKSPKSPKQTKSSSKNKDKNKDKNNKKDKKDKNKKDKNRNKNKEKDKKTKTKNRGAPLFRAQSAQTFGGGFVD